VNWRTAEGDFTIRTQRQVWQSSCALAVSLSFDLSAAGFG
jgi:hypothetical protein